MQKQLIFDVVAGHLLAQRQRSGYYGDPMLGQDKWYCTYRAPGGLRCAIGVLIPDEVYASTRLEGLGARTEEVRRAIAPVYGVPQEKAEIVRGVCTAPPDVEQAVRFLVDLQILHDGNNPEEWPRQLRRLAEAYGLSTHVLDLIEGKANEAAAVDNSRQVGLAAGTLAD